MSAARKQYIRLQDEYPSPEYMKENRESFVVLNGEMALPFIASKRRILKHAREIAEACGYSIQWKQMSPDIYECRAQDPYDPMRCLEYKRLEGGLYLATRLLPAPRFRPGHKAIFYIRCGYERGINKEGQIADWQEAQGFNELSEAAIQGIKSLLNYLQDWNLWHGLNSSHWSILDQDSYDYPGSIWYLEEKQKIDFSTSIEKALINAGQNNIGKKAQSTNGNWGFILQNRQSEEVRETLIFWRNGEKQGQQEWVAQQDLQEYQNQQGTK